MQVRFLEATQDAEDGFNWGKFMLARYEEHEWAHRSALPAAAGQPLLAGRGWSPGHLWVCDLQTGEGALFRPGGLASADLNKHRIWVCPMFEPMLEWLYAQDLSDLSALPELVELPAPGAVAGYRRPGQDERAGDEPEAQEETAGCATCEIAVEPQKSQGDGMFSGSPVQTEPQSSQRQVASVGSGGGSVEGIPGT